MISDKITVQSNIYEAENIRDYRTGQQYTYHH